MQKLINITRRLGLGLGLIVAASAILLYSDLKQNSSRRQQTLKIAVVNYTSVQVLEEGEKGLLDGLAFEGFVDGRNIKVDHFNAEGDRPTAIMIAKDVVGRDYDLILTLSTPVLQAVANANKSTQRTHVFTLTTDPWGADIGVNREDHSDHPPYMTGQGTLQPVKEVFDLARKSNPDLSKVGVVWNPAEANSEASTVMARQVCKDLNIELVEVTVDSSSAVSEAAKALVSRGVEAIWAGGDSTVATALDGLISAAADGRIPVFTNMPTDVEHGALFALGADYYEVGYSSGTLAARVLRGESPADIPVDNYVPQQLALNVTPLEKLAGNWEIPSDWPRKAAVLVDADGVHQRTRRRDRKPSKNRTYKVAEVFFAPNAVTDASIKGVRDRLRERGFIEGRNIEYRTEHAQGEMALIPAILQKLDESDVDLIVAHTTPLLTACASMVKNKPVVFTEVYDPIAAGAGTSSDEHAAHITGVGSFPPLEKMIDTMEMLVPDLERIGVVYNNAEANSRKAVSVARDLLASRGLTLEEATVANSSEVLQASQVLTQKNVQVLWEIGDNTVIQGLEGMIKAGNSAGVPVVNADNMAVNRGSVVGVGISFYESGYASGELAARVLLGENPKDIPFEELAEVSLSANLTAARQLNVKLPAQLLQQCDRFHGVGESLGRPARITFLALSESTILDQAYDGLLQGFEESGLSAETDYVIRKLNAQTDMTQLTLMAQSVRKSETDLVITSTTPAMIAAAQQIKDIPIVFTVASYPPAVGVFAEGERQPNLVGVYDDPRIKQLIELAQRREGILKTVATVWHPAEPNSAISVNKLREVCKEKKIRLIEKQANTPSDLPDATTAACLAGAQIIVISADNLTSSGLPAILTAARKQKVPIYSTEPDMVNRGAEAAIGDDFVEWGKQSAHLASRVLAGVPVDELDMEKTKVERTLTVDDISN